MIETEGTTAPAEEANTPLQPPATIPATLAARMDKRRYRKTSVTNVTGKPSG